MWVMAGKGKGKSKSKVKGKGKVGTFFFASFFFAYGDTLWLR